jgi:hypothetical protein
MASAKVLNTPILLVLSALVFPAMAQAQPVPEGRFAGAAQIASQSPVPIHLDLRQTEGGVEGIISIPMGDFAWSGSQDGESLAGPFDGTGGAGELTLAIDGEGLTGTFTLGGAPGTISSSRTALDAQTFFQPPEQRLDLTTAQWLDDLDRLAEILTQEHGSPFDHTSRAQFETEVARVRSIIPARDGVAIALEFCKLGALIGDGHTEVAPPKGRPRLAVELFWFEDGLRVIGAGLEYTELLGSRLTAIGATPIHEVTDALRVFTAAGETEEFFRAGLSRLATDPDILQAAGIATSHSGTFTFEMADGASRTVELAATSGVAEWTSLGNAAPLWLQQDKMSLWSKILPDGSVYVNWRSYDELAQHSEALLQQLDANHPRRLIVDLRDNTGGDFTLGKAFIEKIRSRPHLNRDGLLYVLIGRATFSAAMTNAIDFKLTTNATLVGEPAGAAPNNWQEVRRFTLPHSGLAVGVSTRYYEFLPGEGALRPDIFVAPEQTDWGAEFDAAVKMILSQPWM